MKDGLSFILHPSSFILHHSEGEKGQSAVQILPAIDLRGGQCVRLRQGDYAQETVFGADPVQFIHLIGKDQVYFAYDQQPFANGFPVSDWPVGVDLLDEWSVTLPGDLPPGVYSLYTGLYEWPALTRLNVKDANGQGITNNTVLLGTVNVVAP